MANLDNTAPTRLSGLLIEAQASGKPIVSLPPDLLDLSREEAYATQTAFAQSLGRVIGWKVGRKSPDATPAYAPLFATKLYSSGDAIPRDGFTQWIVEAEIMFRLSHDLPTIGRPYTAQDMPAAIGEAIVVFEIVDSRYAAWPDVPAPLMIADLQSHGAMVLGTRVPFPRDVDFNTIPVSLTFDGETLVSQAGGNPVGDILDLTAWLANARLTIDAGLQEGDLVTTGSYTGMRVLPPGKTAEAHFVGVGSVTIVRGA